MNNYYLNLAFQKLLEAQKALWQAQMYISMSAREFCMVDFGMGALLNTISNKVARLLSQIASATADTDLTKGN